MKTALVRELHKFGVQAEEKDSELVVGLLEVAETTQQVYKFRKKDIMTFVIAGDVGDIEKVIYFLERGMDVNVKDSAKASCIYNAAANGQTELTKLLVRMKGILEIPALQNPVLIAAESGHACALELLLSLDADPNKVTSDKYPLEMAMKNGKKECEKILLRYDAKTHVDLVTELVTTILGNSGFF